MKILILGAGGVGGYYGARLIEAGADITFLVREKRLQSLRANGLQVESPHGDLSLQVKAVTAQTVTPEYDLIVLAPKAYDLDAALASIGNAVGDKAVLLPFLNGVTHMGKLDERYGRARVIGGVAHIAAMLSDSGVVRQLTKLHSLTVGHRHEAHEALARDFFALCEIAKFDSSYSENVEQVLWNKWTFLATLAGATTLFRGSVGKIAAAANGDRLVRRMYAECLTVADTSRFAVSADEQRKALRTLTEPGSPFTASMLRDLLSGQRTEHEHILGEMVRMAKAKELDVPLVSAAFCHMEVEAQGKDGG